MKRITPVGSREVLDPQAVTAINASISSTKIRPLNNLLIIRISYFRIFLS